MHNESHAAWRDRTLRSVLARMRRDGCGRLAGKAELLTGIEGVSRRPVRKIVLIGGSGGRGRTVKRDVTATIGQTAAG